MLLRLFNSFMSMIQPIFLCAVFLTFILLPFEPSSLLVSPAYSRVWCSKSTQSMSTPFMSLIQPIALFCISPVHPPRRFLSRGVGVQEERHAQRAEEVLDSRGGCTNGASRSHPGSWSHREAIRAPAQCEHQSLPGTC